MQCTLKAYRRQSQKIKIANKIHENKEGSQTENKETWVHFNHLRFKHVLCSELDILTHLISITSMRHLFNRYLPRAYNASGTVFRARWTRTLPQPQEESSLAGETYFK